MKKYVIKNCPNYYYDGNWKCPHRCNLTDGDWDCVNDEYGFNCLLKRIVENCMHTLEYFKGIDSTIAYGRSVEAEKVLNELEIEEVNEF